MDAQLKAKWVEALRSGTFKQERNGIGSTARKCLCCLGVGAVVVNPDIDLVTTDDAVKALFGEAGWKLNNGGYSADICTLIEMNDLDERSFAEIADYIEANL
jgi:hypothetical protein